MEAGALDLPSVVTDINGSREIINQGENGLIIPPKDENALYDAMKRMVVDAELRETLVKNARKMVASRFDKEFVQKCLLDFYDEVLKK